MTTQTLKEIAACWRQARYPVVFTGAGMSTESGLPDFRSAQGLWKTRPERLATLEALAAQPDEFYFFYQWRIHTLWNVAPNAGHLALAQAEKAEKLAAVITQNVDGLHQRAGSERVTELHGTLRTVSCRRCKTAYDSRRLLPSSSSWFEDYQAGRYRHGQECQCEACDGQLRPDVVLFGEALPQDGWRQAAEHSENADFFIVVGSALAVSPANLCPQIAKEQGARLLIINQEPTPLDGKADWVVHEPAGEILRGLVSEVLGG